MTPDTGAWALATSCDYYNDVALTPRDSQAERHINKHLQPSLGVAPLGGLTAHTKLYPAKVSLASAATRGLPWPSGLHVLDVFPPIRTRTTFQGDYYTLQIRDANGASTWATAIRRSPEFSRSLANAIKAMPVLVRRTFDAATLGTPSRPLLHCIPPVFLSSERALVRPHRGRTADNGTTASTAPAVPHLPGSTSTRVIQTGATAVTRGVLNPNQATSWNGGLLDRISRSFNTLRAPRST